MTDISHYLRYFSFKKIANAILVLFSFYKSRIQKKPKISGMPIGLSIEPTTSCNLRCPQCPSGLRSFTRPTGMLENNFFKKIIDEHAATLFHLTFYFQGEPYLNPDFLEMVAYAHLKKIFTSTSTNAHYLSIENAEKTVVSGLDKLIISLDGISQESYSKYRIGGKLENVFQGIENMQNAKRKFKSNTPVLVVQFIVFGHNEWEIDKVCSIFKDKEIELQFKTAQIYDFENGSDLLPKNESLSRYHAESESNFSIKNDFFNHCWKMWHSSVITWDGRVVPCCFDKDALHQLGNLSDESFSTIWNSANYNNFRRQLLTNRKEIDICKNCSEGSKIYI